MLKEEKILESKLKNIRLINNVRVIEEKYLIRVQSYCGVVTDSLAYLGFDKGGGDFAGH